jgi:hypothetical protein
VADSEWAVVANVRAEAFGRTRSPGTRHFSAGTLVWDLGAFWGDGGERIRVLGRHRGGRRLVEVIMATRYLVNFRAKCAYAPGVIRALRTSRPAGEAACRERAAGFASWFPPVAHLRDDARQLRSLLELIADGEGRALADRAIAQLETRLAGMTPELEVLGDWLEDRGVGMPLDELSVLLRRRRDHGP